MAAASHYGVDPDELEYREVEKKHGFVRTRRKVVIRVDPDNPTKAPEKPESREEREAAQASPAEADAPEEKAEEETPEAEEETPEAEEVTSESEEADRGRERRRGRRRSRREREDRGPREERAGARSGRDRGGRGRGARETVETQPPPWWHEEGETGEAPREGDRQAAERPEPEPEEEDRRRGRRRRVSRAEGLTRRGGEAEGREPRRRRRGGEAEAGEEPSGRRGRRGRRREPPPRPPAEPEPEVERQPEPPRERPAPRADRLPRVEDEELADAAHEALEMLLAFVDVESEIDLFRNDERLEVELYGPDDRVLLENDGQLLLAIEHLLPRMIRGLYGDAMPVRVDCADFHWEREERLRELARETADEVRRRGKGQTLDEMDPAERRIVHITLADDPSVDTQSVGSGYYKRLKVTPR